MRDGLHFQIVLVLLRRVTDATIQNPTFDADGLLCVLEAGDDQPGNYYFPPSGRFATTTLGHTTFVRCTAGGTRFAENFGWHE